MRDLALTAIILGLLPMILRRPEVGVLTWNWLGFMNPHRLTWGFAYSLPWSQLVALFTLTSVFLHWRELSFPRTKLVWLWIAFIAWTNLTTIFAVHPEFAFEEWDRFMKIQLMVLITLLIMHSPERIKALVWVIVFSLGFYGVKGGVFAILTGGQYRVWGPAGSFIEGNNEIALALIMIVPLMYYLRETLTQKWLRLGMLACIGLCLVAIASTYSRGAFIGGGAMLIFLALKMKKKLIALPLIAALALGAVMFMPQQWVDRMGSITSYEDDSSALGRINAWYFAYNIASDRPLGGGFRAFQRDTFLQYAPDPRDFHDAHSIYFEVLGEQGFLGLALYLSLGLGVLLVCQRVERAVKHAPEKDRWMGSLASMIQVSFVGYAASGAFLGLAYFDLPYQLMAMAVLLGVMSNRVAAKSEALADSRTVASRP